MLTTTPNRPLRTPTEGAGAEENESRAAIYGLLSHLFFHGPDAALIQCIVSGADLIADNGSPLSVSWRGLVDAARKASLPALADEYNRLFVSTGRPAVSLYGSSYVSTSRRGNLLAELRGDLQSCGYTRAADRSEFEDHFSALCDVMRGMIADDAHAVSGSDGQQMFFRRYLEPWYGALCEAISQSEHAEFYRQVARFASAFFVNESEYFELA